MEPSSFRDELLRLQRDSDSLLTDRNVLVHSVAMLDRGEDGELFWSFWHPRSDTEAAIPPSQILEHAHDLGAAASRALDLESASKRLACAVGLGGQLLSSPPDAVDALLERT